MIVGKPPRPGRISCIIGGCGRTAAQEKYPGSRNILCYKCFCLAPTYLKRRKRRLERLIRRMGIERWDQTKPATKERRVLVLNSRAWDQLVTAIVGVKAGIA